MNALEYRSSVQNTEVVAESCGSINRITNCEKLLYIQKLGVEPQNKRVCYISYKHFFKFIYCSARTKIRLGVS